MTKKEVLSDLVKIFTDNTSENDLTSVHGVYDDLKKYMLKLTDEIKKEEQEVNY